MKRFAAFLLALLALAVGGAHWLDLLNTTDLATGFVAYGSYWIRYGVVGGALVLFGLGAFLAPRAPRALCGGSWPQGGICLLCGLGFAALGGIRLAEFASIAWIDRIQGVLYLITAFWMLMLGRSRFVPQFEPPTGSAVFGIAGTLSLYLLCIQRFCLAPTGLVRVSINMQALAVLAALLFCSAQAKAAYLKGGKSGKWVFFTGMSAFLLCSCIALPDVVCHFILGYADKTQLVQEICLGLIGLNGLVCALGAVGPAQDPAAESVQAVNDPA